MYCATCDVELRESPVGVGSGEVFTDYDEQLDGKLWGSLWGRDKKEVSADQAR